MLCGSHQLQLVGSNIARQHKEQLHIRRGRMEQCAKKVVSNSLGLVDFAIGLLNSALNLTKGQVKVVEKFTLQKNCNQCC